MVVFAFGFVMGLAVGVVIGAGKRNRRADDGGRDSHS